MEGFPISSAKGLVYFLSYSFSVFLFRMHVFVNVRFVYLSVLAKKLAEKNVMSPN